MKNLTIILLLFFCKNLIAQQNLVVNYSFEDSVICPYFNGVSWIHPLPKPWYSPTNKNISSWQLHKCALTINAGVPYNIVDDTSYQYPKTGNGYASFHTSINSNFNFNYRTYVQQKLRDTLVTSKSYYVEFFVNLPNSMKSANNNVTMLITKNAVYADTINYNSGLRYIPANAQIVNFGNPIITDTLDWVKVSGIYKGVGGERFITIGNFKDDANTQLIKFTPAGGTHQLLYYLDDVSVIPLDSMCLNADAGKDKNIALGDSVFIGSFTNGIDSLLWLQNGNIRIDSTRPGFFVKPTSSSYYILQQTINGCFTKDTVYINVNAMPLKFTSFTAILIKEKSVQLLWNTADEVNVSQFSIQRSINSNEFKSIGTIKAKNQFLNNYEFVEDSLKGILTSPLGNGLAISFRIEAIDYNGKKTYSPTKQITIKTQTPNIVSIYPNPATTTVNIEMQQSMQQIKLLNLLGETVLQLNNIRANSKSINLEKLVKGIYIIQITTLQNEIKTQKIIIN